MSPALPALVLAVACSDYNLGAKTDAGSATGDCAGWTPAGDYAVLVDETCLNEPAPGTFAPQVEWSWRENPLVSGYHMVMSTPVVGHLTDDDGDGTVGSAGDVPDIAFTAYTGTAYTSPGALTAVSGDGSGTHWSLMDAGGEGFSGTGGVALGDLDGDGRNEVCAAGTAHAVVCVDGQTGALVWAAGSTLNTYGCPALADLDGDGLSEVVFGAQVFAHDGTLLAEGTGGIGGSSAAISVPVDWDGDGLMEIAAGNTIYRMDGSILWSEGTDGYPAIGDFDGDGLPDLVVVGGGTARLVLNDFTEAWSLALPGGGNGGPPTVADFDGDGAPEVGIADLSTYALVDTDGTILWTAPTEDDSSSQTGSSVFDFEGDGAAEVVYADEHTLFIYDGATGAVRARMDDHASGTLMEYPVIADVDGDGSTEIVVPSNDMWWEGWTGITVIGDAHGSWAPARPIWNQHAYHITNVESDGGIPRTQQPNWLTWNNFRAGGTELGPSHWLADLAPETPDLCTLACDGDQVAIAVPVANRGLLDAVDVSLELRRDSPAGEVAASTTLPRVDSGTAAYTEVLTLTREAWGEGSLFALVDGENATAECDEANNTRDLGPWPCGS